MNIPMNQTIIDRLVDGELDENERREALLAIESSPDDWRRCALAFLEAQQWTQAARSWNASQDVNRVEPSVVTPIRKDPSRRRWVIAAVGLTIAFLSGFAARGRSTVQAPAADPSPQVTAGVDPAPRAEAIESDPRPAAISDYVRSQWERWGYQIEQKRRLISMDLDGGRKVSVPFDDIEIRYVGRQTY